MWSLEHFKYYLYDTELTLQTDHRTLLTALNENRGNKTYRSRLTRRVDRLLPFNFNLEHIPGKNMGFADYLSRHPKQKPPPPSTDDTQYIINLKNNFKFIITQNSINQFSATRTMSDKYQTKYLTTNNNKHAYNNDNESAFCLSPINLQSLNLSSSIESQLNHTNAKQPFKNKNYLRFTFINSSINPPGSPSNSNYINSINSIKVTKSEKIPQGYNTIQVTTRSRPKHNTFEQNIIKRKRATNRRNTKMNPTQNTIATQTDDESNKDLGRKALKPNPTDPIFPLSDTIDMPQYRKIYARYSAKNFWQKPHRSTKKWRQLSDLSKKKSGKRASPYIYSLKRDLAVTPTGCVLYDNRLMVSAALKQLVINALHQTHPG